MLADTRTESDLCSSQTSATLTTTMIMGADQHTEAPFGKLQTKMSTGYQQISADYNTHPSQHLRM
jgi:hypothetical protein